ncbi:MAG: UDP-3-O-acyl-N-acetylglucosamine deacetylase [bacterium]
MMVAKQTTLKKEIVFSGIGVHSGVLAHVFLRPAPCNHGTVFFNDKFPDERIVLGKVIPEIAMHATVIKHKSWAISTIEHLLAAIAALKIDNLVIHVKGPEVPILDGSALPFMQEILMCGLEEQQAEKKNIFPKTTIIFEDGEGRFIQICPPKDSIQKNVDTNLYVEYEGDFGRSLLGNNCIQGTISPDFFLQNIAPARTFGFLEQFSFLRSHGLARGANLGNTVVIGDGEFINEVRFSDECIRHKVLDLIGDLGALGYSLVGHVKARRTGHSFNRKVVEHFVTSPSEWIIQ